MQAIPIDPQRYWDGVPFNDPQAEAGRETRDDPGSSAGYATFTLPRRSLLRTVTVLGTALAMSVVGAVPKRLVPRAWATVGTQYTDCTIYSYDGVVCTGAPYARSYCGTDGWFLNFSSATFNSFPITACNNRNAWRWSQASTSYRCADGRQQVTGQSAVFYICMWAL